MWAQLYPTLIARVEYTAYERRKPFEMTSSYNGRWFIA